MGRKRISILLLLCIIFISTLVIGKHVLATLENEKGLEGNHSLKSNETNENIDNNKINNEPLVIEERIVENPFENHNLKMYEGVADRIMVINSIKNGEMDRKEGYFIASEYNNVDGFIKYGIQNFLDEHNQDNLELIGNITRDEYDQQSAGVLSNYAFHFQMISDDWDEIYLLRDLERVLIDISKETDNDKREQFINELEEYIE